MQVELNQGSSALGLLKYDDTALRPSQRGQLVDRVTVSEQALALQADKDAVSAVAPEREDPVARFEHALSETATAVTGRTSEVVDQIPLAPDAQRSAALGGDVSSARAAAEYAEHGDRR